MDSFSNMNFTRYFLLWMLLLSPIYSSSIYSSNSPNIRITETLEETITVDCSPTTTSSTTTSYSTSSYGIILGSSTTNMTSSATFDLLPDTTEIPTISTPLNAASTSWTAPGAFLTSPGTSLTSPGISLTTFSTYWTTSRMSMAISDSPPNTPDTSLAISDTPLNTLGTSLTFPTYSTISSMSLAISYTPLNSAGTSLAISDTPLYTPGTSLATFSTYSTISSTSLAISYIPLITPGMSFAISDVPLITPGISLAISGTPLDTPGTPLGTTSMTLSSAGITESSATVTSSGISQLSIQSEMVLPGASAITIGGIPVSLGSSGTLVIGSSTLTLPSSAVEVYTIGSQPVTIKPTGFGIVLPPHTSPLPTGTVELTALSVGGLSAIGKTPISLGQGGTIGSNVLPTTIPTASTSLPVTLPTLPATVTNFLYSASLAAATTGSISSTITTIPPGFSTEVTTNTLWSTNTWLTTVVGGSPTVVPVLVGCPGCGGIHGGIILWNLPKIPRVSFQIPGFPGLPKFHLPCIRFFSLIISGNCNTPPSTDGDNDDGSSQSDPSQSNPSLSNGNPSSTLVKSSSSIQTSASSTEACILTEVACTQTCTVSSVSGGSAPTTSCGSPGLCQRQAGGGGCTSTTGTTILTSFTTASASAFICKAGSCAGTLCGTSAPNIAPAITTNAPGDQIPSLANLPNPASKRSHRGITRLDKIIKRVVDPDPDPEDPTSIRQLDFTDPNSFYKRTLEERSPKQQWYQNAQDLAKSQGPGNAVFAVGGDLVAGFASSTKFEYADLRQNAITTGSGPSWGCTSVLVYSERGVWIAHFWEKEQMQAADFNGQVLNFIRSGEPGRYEGLDDVVPSLFSGPSPGGDEGEFVEVPIFSGAVIFTPSFREKDVPPPGLQFTDPIYSDKVNQIKRVLVNRIPGFTFANMNEKINVAAYQPVSFEGEIIFSPWLGLLTFEYVPQHVSNDNDACEVLRAIRIHVQDAIQPIIAWNWPAPSANVEAIAAMTSKSKNKRQGACPINLPQILSAQGDGTAEPASFFDISTPVSGVTGVTPQVGPVSASASASASASSSVLVLFSASVSASVSASALASPSASPTSLAALLGTTTSLPLQLAANTLEPLPTSILAGTVLCNKWELQPDGMQVGTDCDGDPNETVTMTAALQKRAIKTVF